PSWKDHQRIDRPTPSKLPPFRDSTNPREDSTNPREDSSKARADRKDLDRKDLDRKEGSGDSRGLASGPGADAAGPPLPSGNGPAAPTTKPFALWAEIHPALTQCRRLGQNSRLQDPEWWRAEHTAFPLVDFVAEVKKAEAWCASNPGKAPRRDVPRFLHRWFAKAHADEAGEA